MYILFIFPAKLSSSVERRRIQETINLLGLAWHALCFNNIFSQGSVAHFPAKKNTLQINVFYIVTILCCSEFSLIRPSNAHYGLLYAYKFVTMFLKYDNVPHQWNGTLPQEVLLYWKDLLPTHQHGVIICFPSSELKKLTVTSHVCKGCVDCVERPLVAIFEMVTSQFTFWHQNEAIFIQIWGWEMGRVLTVLLAKI